MGETLTLSEIIHRHVTIEWTEGVAVVRAVIEHLLGSQRQASTVPELHQVRLTAHGNVEVEGGYKSDEPVRRLGQLLQATLGSSAPPVQLRLVISRATAPTPDFRTILEFDTALEYYERPDRAGMVRALFERAHAAPMATTPGVNATLDSLAPLPSVADKRPTAQIRRKINPRMFRVAAAALILAVAAAAGLRYALAAGAVEVDSGVPQAAAEVAVKASETVGEAVVKGISAVTERVGLGRLVSPDAAPSPPPGAVPPPPDSNKAATVVRSPAAPAATLRTGATVAQVFDLEPLPIVESEDPSSTAASSPPVLESRSNGSSANVDPLTVYSSTSIDVLPPVSLNLPLTRELPPDLRKEDLTRIELLIAMDGTVEWVRLVGQPQTVHDTMWLSAVKAWLFQPALRNGIPVRFRKTIWIAPR